MELHARLVRSQLNFFKPFVANCSLEVTRKGQDKLGELMTAMHRREVYVREHDFGAFQGAWITPHDQRRTGVILYLHGGGYTCGSLEYAKGFGATLAAEGGVRVFCAAYRLAPENRYPAALDDALESYQYLLKKGYAAHQILLCGESIVYDLLARQKQMVPRLGGIRVADHETAVSANVVDISVLSHRRTAGTEGGFLRLRVYGNGECPVIKGVGVRTVGEGFAEIVEFLRRISGQGRLVFISAKLVEDFLPFFRQIRLVLLIRRRVKGRAANHGRILCLCMAPRIVPSGTRNTSASQKHTQQQAKNPFHKANPFYVNLRYHKQYTNPFQPQEEQKVNIL